MTHPELYKFHEPLWAILCYHELCQTVCPPRKWNLPSTDLPLSRTHCLLASKCLVCQSSTPGIDIHLRQTPFLRNHTPKVSAVYPVIPYKIFSSWNYKDIRIISAKESGDYSLKKTKNEKSHSPKELQTRSSNKDQIPLPSVSPSPPSLWHSTNLVEYQILHELLFSSAI